MISYSNPFQFKHLQFWLPIREEFLTIRDTHCGTGYLQGGFLPVSEGPSWDICLSWPMWKQCLGEEGWIGRGRGLKSFWNPKPHFNISFSRTSSKIKMRSSMEFAYVRFLSITGGWQLFILIQLSYLTLDPGYFQVPWSRRAKLCYSEKHTGVGDTEYVWLSLLG